MKTLFPAMAVALLSPLSAAPVTVAEAAPPALRCLPGHDGFLSVRLRGSIEEDVHWTEPALACTGMSRPDGRGLRVRFAGPLGGGELAVVFAAPELGVGASGKSVPVNVTLLDGGGERIYGTQGDGRCEFDEVEQQPVEDAALPARSYRISARGFCVAPARALDGDGAVLLTRFDFAGLVSFGADDRKKPTPELFPALEQDKVQAMTATGSHEFSVWIAADAKSRERGLMYVRDLPPDRGMLFLFEFPQELAFWMKNTYVPLDLVFIAEGGTVINIAANATPLSLEPIESEREALAVLEVRGGTAKAIGLKPGDRVSLPSLRTTGTTAQPPKRP